jgi:RLL motif containing protein 1
MASKSCRYASIFDKFIVTSISPPAWFTSIFKFFLLTPSFLFLSVGLEYADKAAQHNTALDDALASAPAPQDWAPPPLPPYSDATSPETLAALKPIFSLLHIPLEEKTNNTSENGNSTITAEQIRKIKGVLESQVLPCLAAARKTAGGNGDASAAAVLSDFPLGFSTGDPGVDIAATVLRMLYIKDMRELQDQIDAAIVKMQEITAEPKTDATMRRDR